MMKILKLIFLIIVIAASCSQSQAFDGVCQGSAEKSADASIFDGAGYILGIMMATDGTNDVTVDIHDNATSATGKNLIPTTVMTTSASNRSTAIAFDPPIAYYNGIYVNITTSGTCSYTVSFQPRN